MTVLLVLLAATGGSALGAAAVLRSMPRVVARMSPPERVAFARKVTRLAEIREVK